MGCNCGKSIPQGYNSKPNIPTITNGTNQKLLQQIVAQQKQQQTIQQIIQQSANPNKTVIKTYR